MDTLGLIHTGTALAELALVLLELPWDGVQLGGLLQRHLYLSLGAEVIGWGPLLFPEAEGAMRPGDFASLGLGVDNVR